MTSSLPDFRGSLILADYVGRDESGKSTVAGTYTTWHVRTQGPLVLNNLAFYVRLQSERTGEFPCSLRLVPRADPTVEPIQKVEFDLLLDDPTVPFEGAIHWPKITIPRPPEGLFPEAMAPILQLLFWLKVAEDDIASCPFNIIFYPVDSRGDDAQSEDGESNGRREDGDG